MSEPTKKCVKCGEVKPLSEFCKRSDAKDGHRNDCKICSRLTIREHYRNNKGPYIERMNARLAVRKERNYLLKRDLCCVACGESRPETLDYHHKNPKEKEYAISEMIRLNKSDEEIAAEITKCVVFCSNCHRTYHFGSDEDRVNLEKYITDKA